MCLCSDCCAMQGVVLSYAMEQAAATLHFHVVTATLLCRYDLTSFQSGLIVSASLLGALAGSSAAFVVGDKLGRRKELILAAVLYGDCPPSPLQLSLPNCHLLS